MRPREPLDYDQALDRLIQLRFEARQSGEEVAPEILQLERQIYAYVRGKKGHGAPGDRQRRPESHETQLAA
jgi:hypothetical protein